jgi:hypothetical protein
MVYNEDTEQAKMIDFGLMTEAKDVQVRDLNWSYPPEVELYNSNEYDYIIIMSTEDKKAYAKSTTISLLEDHKRAVLKYIYYEPIDGKLLRFASKLGQQFASSILDMDGGTHTHTVELYPGHELYGYDAFNYISLKTFDSYGVGLSCVSMINRTMNHLDNSDLADELKNLFMHMVNWNLFIRFTPDQIMITYEGIMQKYGLLEKYGFRFENHKLVKGYIAPLEIKGIKAPDPNELKIIEISPPMSVSKTDKPITDAIVPPKPPTQKAGSVKRKKKTNKKGGRITKRIFTRKKTPIP